MATGLLDHCAESRFASARIGGPIICHFLDVSHVPRTNLFCKLQLVLKDGRSSAPGTPRGRRGFSIHGADILGLFGPAYRLLYFPVQILTFFSSVNCRSYSDTSDVISETPIPTRMTTPRAKMNYVNGWTPDSVVIFRH